MRTVEKLVAAVLLAMCSIALQAEETYRVTRVWPEAPQGWHFYQPRAIAVDKFDNVYIGDSGNFRIKKFDAEGRFITQWGSPGQEDGQFSGIDGVKVGGSGTVYVIDGRRIQMFTAYGQFRGGLERKAPGADKVALSVDVAEDDQGNILVLAVDPIEQGNRVRYAVIEKYSADGEFITQWEMGAGSGNGQVQAPMAISLDASGNIYVVERGNDRVQKFSPSGEFLTKWAARGGGHSVPYGPRSIATNESGDVYVLSRWTVEKFSPTGELLATWQIRGAMDQIALDSQSNVFVANRQLHSVLKFDDAGNVVSEWGSGSGTTDGRFGSVGPGSIAVDPSGCAVVADPGNHRVQRFTPDGEFISKWGTDFWFGIEALATDGSGNLYAVCVGSDEVQKYNRDRELICRWGGTGNGDGQFRDPSAVAISPSGNAYVADTENNRVQMFSADGQFLAKWGEPGAADGQFKNPFFVAVDRSGNVWVADQHGDGQHRMQKFDASGKFLATWTRNVVVAPIRAVGDEGIAVDLSGNSYYAFEDRIEKYDAEGNLIGDFAQEEFAKQKPGKIKGICIDRAGNLYVTDSVGTVMRFDVDGRLASTWTAKSMEGYGPRNARPITSDGRGNVYILLHLGQKIHRFSSEGKALGMFRIAPPTRRPGFTELGGVTVDSSGNIYAVDSVDLDWEWGLPAIQKFDANGQFIATWDLLKNAEGKIRHPAFIAVDGSGNAYMTDRTSYCVHKLDARGKYIKSWGGEGTGDGQFDTPEGIAADGSGHVYVCDRQNSRIQKFDSNGKFLTKWGKEGSSDGEFHFPAAVAVDKEGNVFVADSDNHRVQKFTAEGTFVTTWGQFGEAPGQFNVPLGIAVDKEGNVYVSDSHNHRIQKFAPAASR